MADMGLAGMAGAGGVGDAMSTIFDQRMRAAAMQQQQQQFQQQMQQQDALTRLKFAEQAEATRSRLEASRDAQATRDAAAKSLDAVRADNEINLLPTSQPVAQGTVEDYVKRGGSGVRARFQPMPITDASAPPPSIAAPGDSGSGVMPGTVANSPAPNQVMMHRIPTQPEIQHQTDQSQKQNDSEENRWLREQIASMQAAARASAASDRQSTQATSRWDKSYDAHTKRVDAMEKPLMDQAERLGRLRMTINQRTPAADAVVAPELLTAVAGGQGSGLRMNEAEISRIVGGRNEWQNLKAELESWQYDPNKAFAITPSQRAQMRKLADAVTAKVQKRLAMINDSRSSLADAPDVESHRRIIDDLKKRFDEETLGLPNPLDQLRERQAALAGRGRGGHQ